METLLPSKDQVKGVESANARLAEFIEGVRQGVEGPTGVFDAPEGFAYLFYAIDGQTCMADGRSSMPGVNPTWEAGFNRRNPLIVKRVMKIVDVGTAEPSVRFYTQENDGQCAVFATPIGKLGRFAAMAVDQPANAVK